MDLAKKAAELDQHLYHAYKAAQNCSDVMMFYYDKDYEIEYDRKEYDAKSGLAVEAHPSVIKLQIDKYCDRIAREYLTILYPDYGFVGEESFDPKEMENEFFWCVDPICGSMGYKKKTGFFGTSVALIEKSKGPVIGALNCPFLKLSGIASAKDNKTFYSGDFKKYKTDGLKVVISANIKEHENFKKMLQILKPDVVDYMESVPSKSIQILGGTYDLYFNLPEEFGGGRPRLWDYAASDVFFRVEEKEFTDFDGKVLDLSGESGIRFGNGQIMAKDKKTLEKCLEAFEELKKG